LKCIASSASRLDEHDRYGDHQSAADRHRSATEVGSLQSTSREGRTQEPPQENARGQTSEEGESDRQSPTLSDLGRTRPT
jgi:hypothetical protein